MILPEKILIVRLGAIGDVTNALVVAKAIEEKAPGSQVGWAVHDLARPLVDGHPSVDRVHLWRKGNGVAGFRAVVKEIREVGYDLAIDLQRIQKSAALARLSGAERVLGYDRGRTKEASWLWTRERVPTGDPGAHMVEQYLDVVRALGLGSVEPRRVLPEDPQAEAWAGSLVEELGAPPLVLCLGASKPPNRWMPGSFSSLATSILSEAACPICLVGGPQDRELFGETIAGLQSAQGITDLVGRTELPQLISLFRRSRLFVGCDTGPMHLAAAVELPVVALFGPADPRRTGPYGDGHRVVRSRTGAMEDLTVPEVLDPIRAALAAHV